MTAPLLKNDGLGTASAPVELGILSEGYTGQITSGGPDQRVSMVPGVAMALKKDGYVINVEAGAGKFAGFSDKAYQEAGCVIMSRGSLMQRSQILFAICPPVKDFPMMSGKILISWVGRLLPTGKDLVAKATAAKVTLIDVTA